MDKYANFDELRRNEVEGADFRVIAEMRTDATAIIAPHAGGIEPGTSEIAKAIAGADLSLYAFEGLKANGNADLHITSAKFDEPKCKELVSSSRHVLAIHGEASDTEVVYIGGADKALRGALWTELEDAGFEVKFHENRNLQGTSPSNICNGGKRGKGVQLEITHGLRSNLFQSMNSAGRDKITGAFTAFVTAVRKGLQSGGAL